MVMQPWLKDGFKLMDRQGRPILCAKCPCDGGTCEERMSAIKEQMAASVEWRKVREERVAYDCEASASGSESVGQYAGSLAVCLPRDTSFARDYVYALWAIEYEMVLTGLHVVYACACNCGGDYEYLALNDYSIAAVVAADSDTVCRPADMCAIYEMELDFLASIHGGILYGEGFLDWLGDNDDWHYEAFRKAWVFDSGESDSGGATTTKVAYIQCQCTDRASTRWKGGEVGVHGVSGFCDDPCPDLLVLRERAVRNGWDWHDAGLIVHQAYSFGDMGDQCDICQWYDVADRIMVMGAAETSGKIYYVACGCWGGIEEITKGVWPDMMWPEPPEGCTPGADFWVVLDWDYACVCNGVRELLLEFPDVFGVVSMAWGSDEKVEITSSWEDPMDPTPVITTSRTTIARLLGGGDDDYIDYRTLSVVRYKCPSGFVLNAYNDQGSRWGDATLYDGDYAPTFLGPRTLWGQDPDVGNRTGHVVAWWMTPCGQREDICFETQQEAEDYYNQWGKNPGKPTACGIRDYFQEAHTSLVEPETGLYYETGGVHEVVHQEEWEDPDGEIHYDTWSEWCVTPDRWCPSGGFLAYHGQAVYYLNWIYTNLGILLNGVDGYHQTWTIYGINGAKGDPAWGDCFGHSGVPSQDENITAAWYGPDYHWCIDGYVPPGQDSDSMSDSTSTSSSN